MTRSQLVQECSRQRAAWQRPEASILRGQGEGAECAWGGLLGLWWLWRQDMEA